MTDLRSAELRRLMTTAEVASVASRQLNAEPLAQLGFGSARDVVIVLVTALSARRRGRMVTSRYRMTIRKQPSGRFYAVLKSGRSHVTGRTFDTKRAAQAWLAQGAQESYQRSGHAGAA